MPGTVLTNVDDRRHTLLSEAKFGSRRRTGSYGRSLAGIDRQVRLLLACVTH